MTTSFAEVSEECAGRLVHQNEELLHAIASKTNTKLFMLPKILGDHSVCIKGETLCVKEAELELTCLANESFVKHMVPESVMPSSPNTITSSFQNRKRVQSRSPDCPDYTRDTMDYSFPFDYNQRERSRSYSDRSKNREYEYNFGHLLEQSAPSSLDKSDLLSETDLFRANVGSICFNHTFGDAPDHDTNICPRLHLRNGSFYSDKAKRWVIESLFFNRKRCRLRLSLSKCREWNVDYTVLSPELLRSNPHLETRLSSQDTEHPRSKRSRVETWEDNASVGGNHHNYEDGFTKVKAASFVHASSDRTNEKEILYSLTSKSNAATSKLSPLEAVNSCGDDTFHEPKMLTELATSEQYPFDEEIFQLRHMNCICFNHTFADEPDHDKYEGLLCTDRVHLRSGRYYSDKAKKRVVSMLLKWRSFKKLCASKCLEWNVDDFGLLSPKLQRANPEFEVMMPRNTSLLTTSEETIENDNSFDDDEIYLNKQVCVFDTFGSLCKNDSCSYHHLNKSPDCYSDDAKQFVLHLNLYPTRSRVILCPSKCSKWNVNFDMLPVWLRLINAFMEQNLLTMRREMLTHVAVECERGDDFKLNHLEEGNIEEVYTPPRDSKKYEFEENDFEVRAANVVETSSSPMPKLPAKSAREVNKQSSYQHQEEELEVVKNAPCCIKSKDIFPVEESINRGGDYVLINEEAQDEEADVKVTVGLTEVENHHVYSKHDKAKQAGMEGAPAVPLGALRTASTEVVGKRLHVSPLYCLPSLSEASAVTESRRARSPTPDYD